MTSSSTQRAKSRDQATRETWRLRTSADSCVFTVSASPPYAKFCSYCSKQLPIYTSDSRFNSCNDITVACNDIAVKVSLSSQLRTKLFGETRHLHWNCRAIHS